MVVGKDTDSKRKKAGDLRGIQEVFEILTFRERLYKLKKLKKLKIFTFAEKSFSNPSRN
jgi:hypothetical protein